MVEEIKSKTDETRDNKNYQDLIQHRGTLLDAVLLCLAFILGGLWCYLYLSLTNHLIPF